MKKISTILAAAAVLLLVFMTGFVAYQWGYMQSAIDNHVAAFSAPAYTALFTGLPFLAGAAVLFIAAFVLRRRGRK